MKKVDKKKKIIITTLVTIGVLLIVAGASDMPSKITQFIGNKIQSEMKPQGYIEISRDIPEFSVEYNDDNTRAYVTLSNFPENAVKKEYSITGGVSWKDYEDTFTIKENTTIQTRYKINENDEYTTGTSKVIVDMKYNIELEVPQISSIKETTNKAYDNKTISTENIVSKLITPNSDDKTIVYEISVTRYSLNELRDAGLIEGENEKPSGGMDTTVVKTSEIKNYKSSEDAEYVRFETTVDPIYGNNLFERVEGTTDELRLTKSGVYKIKLRATTHGGIIKSEEAIEVVTINKVADSGLFEFKTLDGKYYDFTSVTGNNSKGAWVNQDVIVCVNKTLKNLEEDIAMGNLLVTYEFSNATTGTNKPETVLNLNNLTTMDGIQNAVEKITDSNTTNFAMKIKIGSITITKNYEINIDKINPESPTISVTSGNEGNSSWYKTDVTLKVTAGKDEGGSDMKDVSYEYTGPITKTNTHISSGGTFTLSTEGTYNIKCYTYDNVGNVSSVATKTIKIDKTAPTITVSPSSATVCKSKSVTITAADTGTSTLNSGNSYQYYLSTSSSALTGGSWTNYTSGSSFTIGNGLTGTYYLYVRQISDVVGNISTTNGTLTTISGTAYHRFGTYVFDNSAPNAPTIEVTSGTVGDNSWYKSNVTLKVTGTDVGTSGVKNVTYQYTGTSTKAATSLTNGSTFTISTDGTYNITCYTYDSLGHVSSATTKTIKIDKTAPTINSFTAANSCNQSIFTGKATDSVSGIVGWQINTSAGTYTSITATTSQITKTNTVTATTTKYFYVKDAAGNVATSSAVKGTVTGSHSYSSKVTKAATCTAAGTRTYTCSVCGTYYTESIPATGHSYSSKVTKAATCTTAGTRTYTCGSCGTYYTQSIAATGHSPGSWQKTSSTHYKKCSTCQAYTSGPSSHGYNTNRCTQVVSGKQCTVYKACGTCGYTRTSHTHSY